MRICLWLMRGISVLSWLLVALCVVWLALAKLEGVAWTDRSVTRMLAALIVAIWLAVNSRWDVARLAAANRLAKNSPSNATLREWAKRSRPQHELED